MWVSRFSSYTKTMLSLLMAFLTVLRISTCRGRALFPSRFSLFLSLIRLKYPLCVQACEEPRKKSDKQVRGMNVGLFHWFQRALDTPFKAEGWAQALGETMLLCCLPPSQNLQLLSTYRFENPQTSLFTETGVPPSVKRLPFGNINSTLLTNFAG